MRSKRTDKIISDLAEEYGLSKYDVFDICYSQFEYVTKVMQGAEENIRLRKLGVFRRYVKASYAKRTERKDEEQVLGSVSTVQDTDSV